MHFNRLENDLKHLTTLVENRTIYSANNSELNLFETHQEAYKVSLTFNEPIIACMIQGKKVMHLDNMPGFDFFPNQSVVLAPGKEMIIDFPEADLINPTRCLALALDQATIRETVAFFNSKTSIENDGSNSQWNLDRDHINSAYLDHNVEINILVNRLVTTFKATNHSKDALLELMIKELIVRLLQTKAKGSILQGLDGLFNNNRIAASTKYIREHLTEKLSIEDLAKRSYMSVSNFYKSFKNTIGESPVDYINAERIKFAKRLILSTNKQLADIAFLSGFNNVSYFNRQFKKQEHMTPNAYREVVRNKHYC